MARRPSPVAVGHGARLLALDLAGVSGALEEIGTTWRRAWLTRPELPLRLALRLQDTARQLAADVRELGDAGPGQARARALSVTSRLCALQDGLAFASYDLRPRAGRPPHRERESERLLGSS